MTTTTKPDSSGWSWRAGIVPPSPGAEPWHDIESSAGLVQAFVDAGGRRSERAGRLDQSIRSIQEAVHNLVQGNSHVAKEGLAKNMVLKERSRRHNLVARAMHERFKGSPRIGRGMGDDRRDNRPRDQRRRGSAEARATHLPQFAHERRDRNRGELGRRQHFGRERSGGMEATRPMFRSSAGAGQPKPPEGKIENSPGPATGRTSEPADRHRRTIQRGRS